MRRLTFIEIFICATVLGFLTYCINPAGAQEFTRTIATATNISIPIVNATDNVSYATGANNTAFYISKQTGEAAFGAWAEAGANVSIIGTSGVYNFPLNATEMDNTRIAIMYNGTGCLKQFVVVNTAVQAAIDVIDGIVDDILTDTGTTLPASLGGLTNVTLNESQSFNMTGDITGSLSGSVGSVTTGGIVAASFAAGAIDASAIAASAITSSEFAQSAADLVWGTAARTLTALDEDSTTIDLNASYVGGVTTFDEDLTTIDINGTVLSVTTAGIADAVWDEARADHTTGNTFGGDALDNDVWTDAKAGYLDEAISGIDDNPWDAVARTLTALDEDDTTIDLNGTTLSITAAGVADAVWDEAQADHVGAGSFGLYLDTEVSGVGGGTAADIADAVWDEDITDHDTANSAGEALSAAQSAGDPWATDLPGSYTGDDAGKKILDYIKIYRGR